MLYLIPTPKKVVEENQYLSKKHINYSREHLDYRLLKQLDKLPFLWKMLLVAINQLMQMANWFKLQRLLAYALGIKTKIHNSLKQYFNDGWILYIKFLRHICLSFFIMK